MFVAICRFQFHTTCASEAAYLPIWRQPLGPMSFAPMAASSENIDRERSKLLNMSQICRFSG